MPWKYETCFCLIRHYYQISWQDIYCIEIFFATGFVNCKTSTRHHCLLTLALIWIQKKHTDMLLKELLNQALDGQTSRVGETDPKQLAARELPRAHWGVSILCTRPIASLQGSLPHRRHCSIPLSRNGSAVYRSGQDYSIPHVLLVTTCWIEAQTQQVFHWTRSSFRFTPWSFDNDLEMQRGVLECTCSKPLAELWSFWHWSLMDIWPLKSLTAPMAKRPGSEGRSLWPSPTATQYLYLPSWPRGTEPSSSSRSTHPLVEAIRRQPVLPRMFPCR